MEKYTLTDGNSIPCMGFGCFNAFGDEIRQAVEWAIEAGYRYIDSAQRYGNEEAVGRGIAASPAAREELHVLSKIWPSDYSRLEATLCQSMKDLRVEYLDTYLLHWPWTDEALRLAAYEKLLEMKERGLIRTAGVSNFFPEQTEKLKEEFGAYPPVIELEVHPSYQQREMVDWYQSRGIRVIAYSPINRNADLGSETVRTLAEKYGKTPAQVVLRWHLQKGTVPIPKSSNPGRIRENIDFFDFQLSGEEVAAIDALERGACSGQDPRTFPKI